MPRSFAFVLATALCSTPALAQGLDRAVVERLRAATVFIQVEHQDPLTGEVARASGSGFFAAPGGYVLTNWHVVRPTSESPPIRQPLSTVAIRVFVRSSQDAEVALAARIVATDPDRDLALLATGADAETALAFASEAALLETLPVWAVGFPLGERFGAVERGPAPTFTRGSVTALRRDNAGVLRTIQVDVPLEPGNSGGPVVDATGAVVGISQAIVRDDRTLSFTVPAGAAARLIAAARLVRPWVAEGRVTFRSDPPGAAVFLDGALLGTAGADGLSARVPLGLGHVSYALAGHATTTAERVLADGMEVCVVLVPPAPHALVTTRVRAPACSPAAPPDAGRTLYASTFDDRRELAAMEQTVGGEDQLSWYQRDGWLRQHATDSLLHAIYTGRREWRDYAVRATLRIDTADGDARAGLVVRETEDGFYLLRLHRGTDQVQLAYHRKAPFGWLLLGQRDLGFDVGDESHVLEVHAVGTRLACWVDAERVFDVTDTLAAAGRIGFYAVDGRAAFDDVSVRELALPAAPVAAGATPYLHWWFTDAFDRRSRFWTIEGEDGAVAPPLLLGEAGAIARADPAAGVLRVATLSRYALDRFQADVIFRVGAAGTEGACCGLRWACREEAGERAELRVLIDHGGKGRLVERRGGKDQVHAVFDVDVHGATAGGLGGMFAGGLARLRLVVDGRRVVLADHERALLTTELPAPSPAGGFGVAWSGAPVVLHQLRVASVEPPPGR